MGRVRFAQKFYKSTQIIQISFLNDINKKRDESIQQKTLWDWVWGLMVDEED